MSTIHQEFVHTPDGGDSVNVITCYRVPFLFQNGERCSLEVFISWTDDPIVIKADVLFFQFDPGDVFIVGDNDLIHR